MVRALRFVGWARRCPVCGWPARRFRPFRHHPNPEAACALCRSLERHRFFWAYARSRTDLFDGRPKRMLHVAPEECLAGRLQERIGRGYLSADTMDGRAMVRMDVTAIDHPDETFDVIYCSHVLEHVADDRKAMRELHRVLERTGWAVLLVPVLVERTIEDPSVVDPAARLRLYGQEDHVRLYGRDYVDRLKEAGFDVEQIDVPDVFTEREAQRMGIAKDAGSIHLCRRAAST